MITYLDSLIKSNADWQKAMEEAIKEKKKNGIKE